MPVRKRIKNLELRIKHYALPAALFIILIALFFLTFEVIFQDKFLPFTYIGDTNITFLTKAQAQQVAAAKFNQRVNGKILTIDLATSSAELDYSALGESLKIGRQGTLIQRLKDQLKTLFLNVKIRPKVYLNLDQQLEEVALA